MPDVANISLLREKESNNIIYPYTHMSAVLDDNGDSILNSLNNNFDSKVDKNQGADNAGKALVVGDDGNLYCGDAGSKEVIAEKSDATEKTMLAYEYSENEEYTIPTMEDFNNFTEGLVADKDSANDNTRIAYTVNTDEVEVPTMDEFNELKQELANVGKPTDEQISTAVSEYLLENPPDTGVFIDDNSVSHDSTWSSQKIASELNKIEHTLTISLNAIDGGYIHTTVIIENTTTGEVVETLDYNNEILYVVLPKYFGYRVTIGDVDGYAKPNVNVFTGVMNRDITISATYKFGVIYGYHVNNNESDPASAVTYLEDAIGFTPAKMNYSTDAFGYGSWENAFFMPKPCMLKRDGTVDYYLDANNYALKENGEPSDIENEDYDGNAMMEWGQNGKKIYYKMVNDEDGNGYSVYISDFKAYEDYHYWSFINNQGKLVDHFYTPIYNGSLDSNNCLRSLSGKAYMMNETAETEISHAKANNLTTDMLWYTEVYCDIILINSLLVLMGKSLNTQDVYGQGYTTGGSETVMIEERTGTMNDMGMFYGTNDTTHHVKVFGMENWWGCQWRRFGGLMLKDYKYYYKLTNGTQDGSTAATYGLTTDGMIESEMSAPTSRGYQKKRAVENGVAILLSEVGGSDSTYYCDGCRISSSETYARHGGRSIYDSECGAFCLHLGDGTEDMAWSSGATLSCKPLER